MTSRTRSTIHNARDILVHTRNLPRRMSALEAAVQENRELNRRVAELLDVVTELLLPIADRDEDRVNAVLAKYRDESFRNGG